VAGVYGPIDFYFAPVALELTLAVAEVLDGAGKLLIASRSSATSAFICTPNATGALPSGCTRAGQRRWKHLWTTAVPSEYHMLPVVYMAKLAGASTVAAFSENNPTIIGTVDAAVEAAITNGMTVVYNAVLPSTASGAKFVSLLPLFLPTGRKLSLGLCVRVAASHFTSFRGRQSCHRRF